MQISPRCVHVILTKELDGGVQEPQSLTSHALHCHVQASLPFLTNGRQTLLMQEFSLFLQHGGATFGGPTGVEYDADATQVGGLAACSLRAKQTVAFNLPFICSLRQSAVPDPTCHPRKLAYAGSVLE